MTYVILRVAVYAVLVALIATPGVFAAEPAPLLGDGCYFIPSDRTLVKILVGAENVEGGLVAELTSGELWFLKAFFGLDAVLTDTPKHLQNCFPVQHP